MRKREREFICMHGPLFKLSGYQSESVWNYLIFWESRSRHLGHQFQRTISPGVATTRIISMLSWTISTTVFVLKFRAKLSSILSNWRWLCLLNMLLWYASACGAFSLSLSLSLSLSALTFPLSLSLSLACSAPPSDTHAHTHTRTLTQEAMPSETMNKGKKKGKDYVVDGNADVWMSPYLSNLYKLPWSEF